jgi:hypothetical protein
MSRAHSIRIATVAALGLLLVLWGDARAQREVKAGAAETLEVQVLEAQVPPDQGEQSSVHTWQTRQYSSSATIRRSGIRSRS